MVWVSSPATRICKKARRIIRGRVRTESPAPPKKFPMIHAIDLIVFDLDGTLVDSLPDLAVAANSAFAAWDCRSTPWRPTKR